MQAAFFKHAFQRPSREQVLATLLSTSAFAVALCGSKNEIATGIFVGLLEWLFILTFYISYRRYDAYRLLRQHRLIYGLFCCWFLCVVAGYLRLFLVRLPVEDTGFYHLAASVRLLQTVLHVFFVLSVASFLLHAGQYAGRVLYALLAGILVLLGVYLYQWACAPVLDAEVWFMGPPLAFHIRLVGYLAATGSAVALAAMLTSGRGLKTTVFFLFLLSLLALLFWLGGRASLLAGLAVMAVGLFIVCFAASAKRWQYAALLLVSVLLAYYLAQHFFIFPWNGFSQTFHKDMADLSASISPVETVNLNRLTTGRLQIWRETLQALTESLWLGWGPNGYLFIPGHRIGFGIHPHNFVVQFLIEWGVLGAVSVLALLLMLVVRLFRQLPQLLAAKNFPALGAAFILLALSINGLADGTFYHAQSLFYLSLAFAIFPFFKHRSFPT